MPRKFLLKYTTIGSIRVYLNLTDIQALFSLKGSVIYERWQSKPILIASHFKVSLIMEECPQFRVMQIGAMLIMFFGFCCVFFYM